MMRRFVSRILVTVLAMVLVTATLAGCGVTPGVETGTQTPEVVTVEPTGQTGGNRLRRPSPSG